MKNLYQNQRLLSNKIEGFSGCGYIGYDIRPRERRKGFGTILLKLTLQKALAFGFKEVIVTCDSDNTGSVLIIIKNGGQLFGVATSDRTGKEVKRYRIALAGHENRRIEIPKKYT